MSSAPADKIPLMKSVAHSAGIQEDFTREPGQAPHYPVYWPRLCYIVPLIILRYSYCVYYSYIIFHILFD